MEESQERVVGGRGVSRSIIQQQQVARAEDESLRNDVSKVYTWLLSVVILSH